MSLFLPHVNEPAVAGAWQKCGPFQAARRSCTTAENWGWIAPPLPFQFCLFRWDRWRFIPAPCVRVVVAFWFL